MARETFALVVILPSIKKRIVTGDSHSDVEGCRMSTMTRPSRRDFLLLSAAGPFAARAIAQDATFSTGVSVVNVLASVRDRDGRIVRDIKEADFKLEEDGKQQTIKYFSQQSDLGLTIGLTIDTSGSQRLVLNDERRASRQFIRRVLREDKDQAFVLHFDGEVELLQDLTSSKKLMEDALADPSLDQAPPRRQQRPVWGGNGPMGPPPPRYPQSTTRAGTALYDAVLLASDELMRKQQGRKALILLSDGEDQGSKVTLSRSIESAQRADTLVYAIYFASSQMLSRQRFGGGRRSGGGTPPLITMNVGKRPGIKVLDRIARETGGAFYQVTDDLSLDEIYKRIEEELRNQYSLGYTPSGTKFGYHRIKVSVATKGLTVQAREGYYSQ